MTDSNMMVVQQGLELDGIEDGVIRYRHISARRKTAHNTPERKVIGRALERMVPAVDAEKRRIKKAMKKAGRPGTWWPPFLAVDSSKLALLTLAEMLDWRDERKSTSLQIDVANMVKTELMYDAIRSYNKDKFGQTDIRSANWSDQEIAKIFKKLGLKPVKWSISDKLLLGGQLVRIALESTQMFNLRYCAKGGPHRECRVDPKPEVIDELLRQHSELEMLRPVLPPMVVPPVDWVHDGQGGYLFISKPLVREAFDNHEVDYRIPSMDVPLEALNYIQSTPWRINRHVLEVMQQLWKNGGGVANMPPAETKKPTKEQSKNRDWWRRKNQDDSRRFSVIRTLSIARKHVDHVLWFPHNFDFRGRVYPLTSYLNPQGDDLCRGLLMFSEPMPLGRSGLIALKIHMANCAGVDKVSLQDRVKWWNDTWAHAAMRPWDALSDRRWTEYENPVQFLAAMQEINRAYLSGHPESYPSSTVVYIDGSNNGLQHLSAMIRDEVGGTAVNLRPSKIPEDMYTRVADAVSRIVEHDCTTKPLKSEHDMPEPWALLRGKITRKMVKRCTLAYPYGISGFGMKLALMQDGHLDDMADNTRSVAGYLARCIQQAISDVVVRSAELMRWMQQVAEMMAQENIAVSWVAPHGFPVCQAYLIKDRREIKTALHRCSVLVPASDRALNAAAQARGIVANFTHSIDAAHLMAVALALMELGWQHAAWIHDSIGVHACRVEELHRIVRDEFVALHENPILQDFAARLGKIVPDLPELPEMGRLDLNDVRNSTYFFA